MSEFVSLSDIPDVHAKVLLNSKIRESARQLFDLACDMARESSDPNRFWEQFDKLRPEVAENVHKTRPKEKGKMTDLEARRFGARSIPFGEFAGRRVDDVPLDRLEWYACQNFVDDLRRYLKADRIQREGGQTQEETYCNCLPHEEFDGRGYCRVCGRKRVNR